MFCGLSHLYVIFCVIWPELELGLELEFDSILIPHHVCNTVSLWIVNTLTTLLTLYLTSKHISCISIYFSSSYCLQIPIYFLSTKCVRESNFLRFQILQIPIPLNMVHLFVYYIAPYFHFFFKTFYFQIFFLSRHCILKTLPNYNILIVCIYTSLHVPISIRLFKNWSF